MSQPVKVQHTDVGMKIETDAFKAEVTPKGAYRTGVLGGTFLDKRTGARDLGHGLNVTDFPSVPNPTSKWQTSDGRPVEIHGTRRLFLPVEGPQLCTGREAEIEYEITAEKSFVVVHEWFTFTRKRDGAPGSRWDEWLLFPGGRRHFFAFNKLTAGDDYFKLALGGDWPGHLKGDRFENIYLSYHGVIPKEEFAEDFPPDTRFFYHRDFDGVPERMIRGYQITVDGKPGPWLAGLTLDPGMMHQAWCHRRGYICFIGHIGGVDVERGESFSNVNLIGFFDSIDEMHETYDRYVHSSPVPFEMARNL